MTNHLGSMIKQLRIHHGLTQRELADQICTQAEISRIESGKVIPYANVLYQISLKLGVEMEAFFRQAEVPNYEYIENTFDTLRRLVKRNQYEEVREIVELELRNPTFAKAEQQQFLLWHQGMAHFYLEREAEPAIERLEQALRLQTHTVNRELEIQILNTIGNVYADSGQFALAEQTFCRCLDALQKWSSPKSRQLEIRLCYNFALALSKAGQDTRSIPLCKRGLKICKQLDSLYLLGELYYQLGFSLGKLNKSSQACKAMQQALYVFWLLEKEEYARLAEERLAEWRGVKETLISE